MRRIPLLIIVMWPALAQAQVQPSTPAPARDAVRVVDSAPAPPGDYAYDADSRRDPFLSLVNRGTEAAGAQTPATRPDGIAGILCDEVVIRGILKSQDEWVAMIGSPSGRTYSIRPGDRLMDGTVRAITAQSVVLSQQSRDPLSPVKPRDVRKFLRGEVK